MFKLKRVIELTLLPLLLIALPVKADSYKLQVEDWYTPHAMGCMMLGECTKDIDRLTKSHIHQVDELIKVLNDVNVEVYSAPQHYFPVGVRGVYYSMSNKIFINKDLTKRDPALLYVMRHEGWHAVQDCMAGSIDNSLIAIVFPESIVPEYLQRMTEDNYSSGVIWEKEAKWAGYQPNLTFEALKVCRDGVMWETFQPTPLTKEFLVEEGFLQEK